MSVGELALERKDRPAYVRFERVAVEDKAASLKAGHYVAKDVDFALITPPYSKDVFKIKVSQWKENMKLDVHNERLPVQWMEKYLEDYERWLTGQEIPLNGSPIKGWGVISPAQQKNLIEMNILTVEDLAGINDEGIRRIGMGGLDLKHKAKAWLSQLQDKGPLTQEIASVKAENQLLKTTVAALEERVKELAALVEVQKSEVQRDVPEISTDDIMEKRGPGRPRKV